MTDGSGMAPATPLTPCHLDGLFVKHDGLVYPCCMLGGGDGQVADHADTIIGHVADPDLPRLLEEFTTQCRCQARRFRPARPGDKHGRLNLELSLRCQGRCAMCCVFAPEYTDSYELYPHLDRLIDSFAPADILFQGGEVLVQRESLDWIAALRRRLPDTPFLLATNGCVGTDMVPEAEALFDAVHISIVGFQPETYRAIMGLELTRTKAFAQALCRGGKTRVQLKYMAAPNNFHEIPLFLDWAVGTGAQNLAVETITVGQYIVLDTFDDYWRKIFRRTGRETRRILDRLRKQGTPRDIHFSGEARRLLELDEDAAGGAAYGASAEAPSPDDILDDGCDQAWQRLDRGELEAAETLLRDLDQRFPGSARVLHALAVLELRRGRPQEGLDAAERGLSAHPGNPRLTLTAATLLAKLDRHDEAIARIEALLERFPLHWSAHCSASDIHRYAGRWDKALEHLERALTIHPQLRAKAGQKRRIIESARAQAAKAQP